MNTAKLKQLLSHQQDILSKIALGIALDDVLQDICLGRVDLCGMKNKQHEDKV